MFQFDKHDIAWVSLHLRVGFVQDCNQTAKRNRVCRTLIHKAMVAIRSAMMYDSETPDRLGHNLAQDVVRRP